MIQVNNKAKFNWNVQDQFWQYSWWFTTAIQMNIWTIQIQLKS